MQVKEKSISLIEEYFSSIAAYYEAKCEKHCSDIQEICEP